MSGRGIPAAVEPDDTHRLFMLDSGIWEVGPYDGKRKNVDSIVNNLGQPGSYLVNVEEDRLVCSVNPVTGQGYQGGDPAETMRKAIQTNPTSPGVKVQKPPLFWANRLKPSLLTIWAGNNDSLGVVSAPPGGMIVDGNAWECNSLATRAADDNPYYVAQNLTSSEFDVYFEKLVNQIAQMPSYQNEALPDMIFFTLPPVYAAATVMPLNHRSDDSGYNIISHPFADLDPRYRVSIKALYFSDVGLDPAIRDATFAFSREDIGGYVSLLAMMRQAGILTQGGRSARFATIFGSRRSPRFISNYPQEILSAGEMAALVEKIDGFNRAILEKILTNQNSNWQAALKAGKIQVFDASYFLSRMAGSETLWNDPASKSAYAVITSPAFQGIVPSAFKDAVGRNDQIIEDMVQELKSLRSATLPNGMTTKPLGGLFSLDHIHLTQTASNAVANVICEIMAEAARSSKSDSTFGGFPLGRLANKSRRANLKQIFANDPLGGRP